MIYSYEFDFLIFERNYYLMLNKSTLSERDICTKYITPALEKAGWDKNLQILEEVGFTNGRIYVRGKLTASGKSRNESLTFLSISIKRCRKGRAKAMNDGRRSIT